ncbi:MAG TPA: DM13 domain-containing protein [Nitrososphaeraceae archaeon]|nr:DM13 domain-containing protein [Nitrososphaeraceae archaeon]
MRKTTSINRVLITAIVVSSVLLMTTGSQLSFSVSSNVERFMNISEDQRILVAQNMTGEERQMVMNEFSKQNSTVDENMTETMVPNDDMSLIGNFKDAGDGFHMVAGVAKIINLEDGRTFLRLESLKATNGPDLYVYLATGTDSSDIVNLGKLKGNIGNQNYEIPSGTDLAKFNTVLIWCKAFSTLFGSANLSG